MKSSRSTPSHSLSRFLYSRDPFGRVFFPANDGAHENGAENNNQSQNNQQQNNQSQNSQSQNSNSSERPDYKALAQAVVAEVMAAQSVNGDQGKALEVLAGRNARLEADRDAKVAEIGVLKSQVPDSAKANADAAELANWRKLEEKGIKKPEDVTGLIAERDDIKGREESRTKVELRDKAAKAAGLDPAKFGALKGVDEWTYDVKPETQDNKTVEVAYVVTKDDKGVETRKLLSEVIVAEFPAMADSIKAGESQTQSQTQNNQSQGTQAQGAQHVAQGSGGTRTTPPDPTKSYLDKKYVRPDQNEKK